VVKPEEVVSKGETVSVLVKDVDLSSRRISLSIRDAQGDPWLEVSEKFTPGQVVEGVLEKKESFGYFITLSPGITGLLPKSKFRAAENPAALEHWNVDDKVVVLIEEIHLSDRKITLAPGDAREEGAWQEFSSDQTDAPMGDLAEKLRRAMEAKNE
jgi:small subunit ribosomal protein S1